MLASEVISEVMKDFEFYLDDGGVTLTGGEPLLQEKFSISILSGCKRQGLSTAIETAGNVPWFQMKGVLEHTDFILYDLKHINSEKHKELTGSGNELILDNLFRADRLGKKIFIRYPFIPCFNEDEKDLPKLFDVLRKLSNLEGIEVLPYHKLGVNKYSVLDREYMLKETDPPGIEKILNIKRAFQNAGFRVF